MGDVGNLSHSAAVIEKYSASSFPEDPVGAFVPPQFLKTLRWHKRCRQIRMEGELKD